MGEYPAIFVLDSERRLGAVCDALEEAGRRFVRVRDIAAAASAATQSETGCVVLAAASEPVQPGSGGRPVAPVLAICDGSVESILAARAHGFEDALPWPQGAAQLCDRIDDLARRSVEKAEALHRRGSAETLTELALGLDESIEFEDAVHEALGRLVEACGAERVMALGWPREGELVYLLGTGDDPTAVKIPAPASAFPEIDQLREGEREVIVEDALVAARVAPYEPQDGTERQTLVLLPLVSDATVFGMVELHFPVGAELRRTRLDFARQFTSLLAPRLRGSALFRSLKEQTRRVLLAEVDRPDALRKYEAFFARSFDGIVLLDNDNRVLYLNPSGEQITGYSHSGLTGTAFETLVIDSDRKRLGEFLGDVRQGNAKGHGFDVGLITTSGDPILVSVTPSAVLAEEGALVLGFRDVTEARALSDELRATKEFLERLIDSTVDGIVASDMDGQVTLFNAGAERITGWNAEEVISRVNLSDLYPAGVGERVFEQLRGSTDGGVGRLENSRKELLSKGGERIPVSLTASIIYEGGVEVGTVGIISDLRDRLRMERRLMQAQEKLIETEKQALIAELAGTTAHELNQPLTSVMGYAELLKKRLGDDEANGRAVDTIMAEAQRMADIVRKIGKITRYETKTYVGGTQILDLDKSTEEE